MTTQKKKRKRDIEKCFYAEDKESDLYAAIDLVTKKVEQQLRQKHSKAKAKTHKVAARLKEKRRTAASSDEA